MGAKRRTAPHYDVFVSHSSANATRAATLTHAFTAAGVTAWHDDTTIRFGRLLGRELQDAIANSSRLLLLWSDKASASQWVTVEWLTALNLDRLVLPCLLDDTPLPACLANALYVDLRRWRPTLVARLTAQLRDAAPAGAEITGFVRGEEPALTRAIATINALQMEMLDTAMTDRRAAARLQRRAATALARAQARWPLDGQLLNLAGYHAKNDYQLAHWDEVQAGRWPPHDPALDESRARFFEYLRLDPVDPGALNGLANVLLYQHEHGAARFFNQAAQDQARRAGIAYPAAEADAELIARFVDDV